MRIPRAIALREELAHYRLVGQGGEGDRGNELLACWCDNHLHLCASLDESSYDKACLVGGNGAGDAQYDFLSF